MSKLILSVPFTFVLAFAQEQGISRIEENEKKWLKDVYKSHKSTIQSLWTDYIKSHKMTNISISNRNKSVVDRLFGSTLSTANHDDLRRFKAFIARKSLAVTD